MPGRRDPAAGLGLLAALAAGPCAAFLVAPAKPSTSSLVQAVPTFIPGEALEWPRKAKLARKRLLGRTQEFAAHLRTIWKDDKPDSPLWANGSEFKSPVMSDYWDRLCNESLAAMERDFNATKEEREHPLKKWAVLNATSCYASDWMGIFGSEHAAAEACGLNCSAVMDVGCNMQKFRTCKMGAQFEEAKNASILAKYAPKNASNASKAPRPLDCVRIRPPPGSDLAKPRPPTQVKFWKKFCALPPLRFRLLFAGKQCAEANSKVLTPPPLGEAACGDLARNDPACSPVFDFMFDDGTGNSKCRCLLKNKDCNAATIMGAAVYIIEA